MKNKISFGISEGLIFDIFEHSFEENYLVFCSLHKIRPEEAKPKHSPIAAVNVSHFLPCDFSSQINLNENITK